MQMRYNAKGSVMVMMNIMGVIPYERYAGREVNTGHTQIMGVYRVPQGEEDSQKEQSHSKKLWESSYKNNFTQFEKDKEREEQSPFQFDNTVDVLEISQEALELFWRSSMTNASGSYRR
jgi:hypothetical protein